MTETTSPRKRALMPTGDLRRKLRGHGHALKPLVHVGKSGVTSGVLAQIAHVLFDHELAKVRIEPECPVDRFAVTDVLATQPGTQVVQLIGRIVLLYKRHPQTPRFEGKASRPAVAEPEAPRARKSSKVPKARREKKKKKR